jgi:hypothetical protein
VISDSPNPCLVSSRFVARTPPRLADLSLRPAHTAGESSPLDPLCFPCVRQWDADASLSMAMQVNLPILGPTAWLPDLHWRCRAASQCCAVLRCTMCKTGWPDLSSLWSPVAAAVAPATRREGQAMSLAPSLTRATSSAAAAAAGNAGASPPDASRQQSNFRLRRIPGDGACMFRAIAQGAQIATHGRYGNGYGSTVGVPNQGPALLRVADAPVPWRAEKGFCKTDQADPRSPSLSRGVNNILRHTITARRTRGCAMGGRSPRAHWAWVARRTQNGIYIVPGIILGGV